MGGWLSWKPLCLPARVPSNQSAWQYPGGYPTGLCMLVLCLRHSDVYFWKGSARKLPKTMFPPQSDPQNIRAS